MQNGLIIIAADSATTVAIISVCCLSMNRMANISFLIRVIRLLSGCLIMSRAGRFFRRLFGGIFLHCGGRMVAYRKCGICRLSGIMG